MWNGGAPRKSIVQDTLSAGRWLPAVDAVHINSRASETLNRVSRNLDVLKCGIDAVKIVGCLVVLCGDFTGDGNHRVPVRISPHARAVLVEISRGVHSQELVVADRDIRTGCSFAPVARK